MKEFILQFFSTADNITAVAAASFVIWQAARGIFRKTIGSKRVARKAIQSLTPGNPIEYVEDMFGRHLYTHSYTQDPPEYDLDAGTYEIEQRLYNAKHGWLTVHYHEGRVCAFAFMLTDPRFKFPVDATLRGVTSGALGRSTYSEIWPETPSMADMFLGAYNWGYSESHFFGRGGNYQHYSLSNTMHGWTSKQSTLIANVSVGADCSLNELSPEHRSALDRYRRVAAPDTIAVFGDRYRLDYRHAESGSYDQDEMRNLEGTGPRGWSSRSDFTRRLASKDRLRLIGRRLGVNSKNNSA